ncbi:type IV secretory system conjugative DNA transfer family protein [Oscillospiraceae bacterium OttesenSCG-928-F05]|nr:type IV secretory system conjugative DNA transfer family protein [Oscillospiraceae bacterium OttesenSCG-928-F05]
MKKETFRILATDVMMSNDTWVTGLNNNDLIIGTSGCGKTRGYVKPNILQCSESMIIADTKNCIRKDVEPHLLDNGYKIISMDFKNCLLSDGYNPLDYVRHDAERDKYSEQDIITVAACMVTGTDTRDPFWHLAAQMYIEAMISYALECLPEEEHNMISVFRLFAEMNTFKFRHLFEKLGEENPDSFGFSRYQCFQSSDKAEKMYESIRGIVAQNLSTFMFDGTKEMFNKSDRIRFEQLGEEKTAVFLNISDTDRSSDKLVSLFYTQALQALCNHADNSEGNRLKIPVRFYLDDFAANAYIPDFDKIISVIRSREISVSVILQSISQLEALYGEAKAKTILNNCDNLLYLGGTDADTARYIGIKANKSTTSILNMPLDDAWLFTRGSVPRSAQKFVPVV